MRAESLLVAVNEEPLVRWDWVADHTDDIWQRTVEHLLLTGFALAIGLFISSFLAFVAIRLRWTYTPITWVAGVLYTIPSLALFTVLIPYTGLGLVTAEIGLVSYTLFILVRNIVAGVDSVPASVSDSARAMGYTPLRRLLEVELPLAAPTIIAGIRIASVTVIGLVTVTALVGAGGYGAFITDGLSREFSTPTVVGAVLSMAMALAFDRFFTLVEYLATPWMRKSSSSRPRQDKVVAIQDSGVGASV